MIFRQLFDRETCTYTYLIADRASRSAVLIDPVVAHVDRDFQLLAELNLELHATLETHVHADHVTGAWLLRERTGCRIIVPEEAHAVGADQVVSHGDVLRVGSLHIEARHTPGHTRCSATYVLVDHAMAFTGDTLLIRGCGRTDFQEGDADLLYSSIHGQILSLPDPYLLYPGHDYSGRTRTTVAEEREHNPRVGGGRSRASFVALMNALELSPPARIDEAVPANRRVGRPLPA